MGLICQKGTVPGGCHQVDAGQQAKLIRVEGLIMRWPSPALVH